ncbi:bifunctional 3-(3-hydroxy-phenyl)propionate/3-hydroxycinnamic acid hydroxylase MhpA [Streptomyces platensis]|uniref:bifunctional 3-(3-hydroxy-phenyl)propionate/3-hydroxycinnamic acid hydroxylase MhpA n=1 Tax=Streptomyces platensis TaxID=58346 RepID=UPI001F223709|nr:bifunctional 3-(3-hydroxy-phenyl)propionate/3-hydroxycinnamic acid hydroxylase [Streptomyces platensis]MCF3142875.1 bifunctional 3-(3-hydroxy-phenyl)propionate/3-hydroxycinnamic acid hydroxylase [Streptomyces platensis]
MNDNRRDTGADRSTATAGGPVPAAGATDEDVYDVLVVGAGPVGLTTAIQLGARGWRVGLVERWPHPYPLPRAVVFDHEVARVLAALGLADDLADFSEPAADYEWRNGRGETLLRLAFEDTGHSGWPAMNIFTQPQLEAALEARARYTPGVEVLRGWEALDLAEDPDGVRLTVAESAGDEPVVRDGMRGRRTLRAHYAVGCDGANSFVRSRMTTGMTDRGFQHDWLVLDVIPHDRDRVFAPRNLQVCDPSRPTTAVSGGPGRRRWEFMLLPGEPSAEFGSAENAWRLLADWDLHPGNATLERHTVYTFRARWAERWREGRLLLAGDAAHQMPPFAGQGMCSGIRDAANLTWKLDLVLSGDADETLLDTYTTERSQHLRHALELSVFLGGIICEPDPAAAAVRDARMLADRRAGRDPLADLPPQVLTGGLLRQGADGAPQAPAGQLGCQGRVRFRGRTGLFDQVVGVGSCTLLATEDPRSTLDAEALGRCERLGIRLLRVTGDTAADGPDDVIDLDGTYRAHLERHGRQALLLRPDHYVFGGTARMEEVSGLVAALWQGLGTSSAAAVPAR